MNYSLYCCVVSSNRSQDSIILVNAANANFCRHSLAAMRFCPVLRHFLRVVMSQWKAGSVPASTSGVLSLREIKDVFMVKVQISLSCWSSLVNSMCMRVTCFHDTLECAISLLNDLKNTCLFCFNVPQVRLNAAAKIWHSQFNGPTSHCFAFNVNTRQLTKKDGQI